MYDALLKYHNTVMAYVIRISKDSGKTDAKGVQSQLNGIRREATAKLKNVPYLLGRSHDSGH